jgi:folylpolyglutamate synthase/dihydropteroate synthase
VDIHDTYSVQAQNACLARAVLDFLRVDASGMRDFYWPCRMEAFAVPVEEALTEMAKMHAELYGSSSSSSSSGGGGSSGASATVTVVLDGCHNEDSMRLFLDGLRRQYPPASHSLLVLFGAGMEKYLGEMTTRVFAVADAVLFVQSRHFKSLPEAELFSAAVATVGMQTLRAKLLNYVESDASGSAAGGVGCGGCGPSSHGPRVRKHEGTVGDRLQWAVNHADLETQVRGRRVVVAVCGSLFAASDAREALYSRHLGLFDEDDWVRHSDPSLD